MSIRSLLVIIAAITGAQLAAAPRVATTVDFLDYAFFDSLGAADHYELSAWEQRIRELADAGISKIYLRVNVCGQTLYPTRVSAIYGADGAFHWNEGREARRLIRTLEKYDPLAETIRIGKKYGLEVWAWENLFDDYGVVYVPEKPEEFELGRRHAFAPLRDPWLAAHPECYSRRNPALMPSEAQLAAVNRDARRLPVARIVHVNQRKLPPIRVRREDVQIYTSSDNVLFRRYDKPFDFSTRVNADGFNEMIFDGLEISDPYIKLTHNGFPADDGFTVVLEKQYGQNRVYNRDGELIATRWTADFINPGKERNKLDFNRFVPTAWDHSTWQMGFVVGEETPDPYYRGVVEFLVPAAMEHKVARFAELTTYPFDGFMFSIRTHSAVTDPENFGFNPEVCDAYRERYGADINPDSPDRAKLFELRAEAVAEFFRRCKAISGDRPVFLSGVPEAPPGETLTENYYARQFGPLPWLYRRYFADGSIDGVVMIGADFPEYFTEEVTGGRKVSLGVFRELGGPATVGEKFFSDLEALMKRDDIDEVELYETLVLSHNPPMLEAIRKFCRPEGEENKK